MTGTGFLKASGLARPGALPHVCAACLAASPPLQPQNSGARSGQAATQPAARPSLRYSYRGRQLLQPAARPSPRHSYRGRQLLGQRQRRQVQASANSGEAAAAPAAAASPALSVSQLLGLLRDDWRLLAGCVACAAVSVVAYVLVAPALGRVVDVISLGPGAGQPAALGAALAALAATYIFSNVGLAVQVSLALAVGESLAARLRRRLFSALLARDALFFDATRTGQMVSWLGQDIEILQSTVAKLLGARGVRSAFETLGIIVVLFALSWPLAVTLLLTAPLLAPLIEGLSGRIRGASRDAQAAAAAVSSAADEVLENVRMVKVFTAETRQLQRFVGLVDAAHALATRVIRLQGLLDVSSRARNTLCVLATLALGAYLALSGAVSIGTCYSFFIYSFSFAFALGNLTTVAGDLARAAGAVSRVVGVVLPQCEAAAGSAAGAAGASAAAGSEALATIPAAEFAGRVELRGVSFRHPGWAGWTLEDVSLTIPAGSTLALVGPSGGGKSTIAGLLTGRYRAAEGEVLVDGRPLAGLDPAWWRRQLGVVDQEPGLLTGRVCDVIAYGRPEASEAEVRAAAAAARADAFIEALPRGYDTVVGAGLELSGGQRQRLAVARALLRRPKVLILDEATSALDVETEAAMEEALRGGAAAGGATCLVIAHRLSSVQRADCIAVVAGGRIVEVGSHAQLLAASGVYAGLVRTAQRRGRDSWSSSDSEGEEGGAAGGVAEWQADAVAEAGAAA